MKYYKNTIKIVALLLFGSLYAQQQPNYALYRYTMNVINPAYAGADGHSSFTANIRSQWIDIKGAPETQTFFYSQPVGKNVGLGLSVVSDQVFVESSTSFNVDFSYRLQFNEDTDIFLGLKAGGSTYNIDRGEFAILDFEDDPALGNIDTGFRPNVGLGAYLLNDQYFVSLSMPNLLLSERISNDNGRVSYVTEKTHVYLSGGYNFDLSESTEFRPSTMIRYVSGAPISVDITAAFRFVERIELGALYRTDSAWAGFAMLNLADWMDIGYGYESSSQNQLSDANDGTHEVLVKFRFN